MGQFLLSTILFGAVMLAGGASMVGAEYPATFKAGRFYISTMEQFDKRVAEKHPELEVTKTLLDKVEFKGKEYPGLESYAEGEKNGTLSKQKLTYVMQYEGLWKLVWVESQSCVKSTILEQGKEVTKWFCDDSPFPISAFGDLFIVVDKNVDLKVIQPAFKDPILPVEDKEQPKKPQDETLSLGDIKKKLELLGSTMSIESVTYVPPLKKEGSPAIKIYVEGDIDLEKSVKQSFVYVIDGEKLRLKEIDGVICQFAETLGKEICDPVYVPTPASPMPLVLLNNWELTGNVVVEEPEQPKVPEKFACNGLQAHHETVLKFHFERSIFDTGSNKEVERFLENYPKIADPMGVFLSKEDKENFIKRMKFQPDYSSQLDSLKKELRKGEFGDCSFLGEPMEDLKDIVESKRAKFYQLIEWITDSKYDLEKVSALDGLTDYQKYLLTRLVRFASPSIAKKSSQAAVDVAVFKVDRYFKDTLLKLSEFEEFVVSAMAKQDIYSNLVTNPSGVDTSLNGYKKDKFFGLSIETGKSGFHYFNQIHPQVAAENGLEVGLKIDKVNGLASIEVSQKQLDELLLDTDTPISIEFEKEGETLSVELMAQKINPLEFYYKVELLEESGKKVLAIDLRSFEAGAAASILNESKKILAAHQIDGITLNMKGNRGGSTDEAVKMMSLFVKDRILTYKRVGSRHVAPLKAVEPQEDFFLSDSLPLIVYVDQGSMSSSEIVASGLQALGRSVTVGLPTFGKLVGQIFMPVVLENKKSSGLLVTAMEFYTVEGKALNGIGLVPDVLEQEKGELPKLDTGIGPAKDLQSVPEFEPYNFSIESIEGQGLSFLTAS